MEHFKAFTEAFDNIVWSTPLFFLLLGTGALLTIVSVFVQWRILTHGVDCIRGRFDRPDDVGHISHFQALSAALSATIGLGNIAGVSLAVQLGGPGAVFWMWVVGLFGMAIKFAECSLAVMFRDVRDVPDPSAPALTEADAEDHTLEYAGEAPPKPGARVRGRGEVRGGPMWYIWKGLALRLKERGNPLWFVFAVLAFVYAVTVMVASFGGGNMFQAWNVGNILKSNFSVDPVVTGIVMSIAVSLVIIGGIRRIGQVASKLVPFMCVIYVVGCFTVVGMHIDRVPVFFKMIFTHAFTPTAASGAFAGVTVWLAFGLGMKRALFSNEAGQGSAAIAHAAARTDEPIREGIVAGLGPFIDTIVICTMTALVILISGAWNRPPVGHVASVDGDTIQVTVNHEGVDDALGAQLLVELADEAPLSVYVSREQGVEAAQQHAKIKEFNNARPKRYGDMKTLTLSMAGMDDEERAHAEAVEVGQPVFLPLDGADMTRFAFDSVLRGFGKYMISIGVVLFAFSTMISWSYYGEKGTEFLFGPRAILPFKFVFIIAVFTGTVVQNFSTVYDFSDALVGLCAYANLPAVLILAPTLLIASRKYFKRLDAGEFYKKW